MSLDEYLKKRDFTKTPEPKGSLKKGSGQLRFVVQRHQASRLHYDLRLEMQGSLKSWAVPKGPSMNPEDKRLAIHTEDHPIEYLNFEGTIPKGNYGAGEMHIWDQGTYAGEAENAEELLKNYKKGDLKLEFSGSRLKGKFALVRTGSSEKKDQWLFIKKKDEFATELDYDAENFTPRSAYKTPSEKEKQKPQPEAAIEPMLASPAKEIFNDPAWIYELKWDGYRVIANIKNGEVKLFSRNGVSYNEKFNRLVRDLEQLENDVILDGEVVVVDKKGIPDFQKLQNYDEKTLGELRFYVFDMLWLNGMEMMNLPLIQRKSLIEEVIENTYHTFYCEHLEGMGNTFFQKAIDAGMEGVIAKKANSTYTPGYRSESWLKIKAVKSLDAIICGYTTSEDPAFKSLILGIYKDDKLDYIGNCGSGFSESRKKELLKKFKTLETKNSPFKEKINLKGRKPIWLKPELVCEVSYSEMTKNGSLRHPVFKGLREDKSLAEANSKQIATKEVPPDSEKDHSEKPGHLNVGGIHVPLSNLDKVYWPESGFTKYDLIDYYLNISEYILPYLKDRPQNLHRHPDGITSEGFYQKDATDLPQWIETVKIDSRSANKQIDYMLCQKEASLLYMANLGCIELNPWNSCIGNLDNPDYTVIDLDPSEKNSFEEVIEVAQAAREILELAKITACCKTSGSKGLHIYIPLQAHYSYEEARNFTKLICYFIQEKVPSLTSMERSLKKRGNKIYLDYLQNRKGQSLASVYCVRPKPGAPVSAAIEWDELKKGLEITDFNIKNMPGRLEKKGDIFGEVLSKGLDMEKALGRLNSL